MAEHGAAAEAEGEAPPKKKGKMMLLLIAVPLLLGGIGAGVYFSGILKPKAVKAAGERPAEAAAAAPPVYVDVPEIVSNLNVPGKRPSFAKLHAKLEVAGQADVSPVTAAMPRIQDLFETYLRDMSPEELRGSEGSYRLREELIARANVAAAPARVNDVLFTELIVE